MELPLYCAVVRVVGHCSSIFFTSACMQGRLERNHVEKNFVFFHDMNNDRVYAALVTYIRPFKLQTSKDTNVRLHVQSCELVHISGDFGSMFFAV